MSPCPSRVMMALLGKLIVATMPLAPKFIIRMVAGRYVAGSNLKMLSQRWKSSPPRGMFYSRRVGRGHNFP